MALPSVNFDRIKSLEKNELDYDTLNLMRTYFLRYPDKFLDFYNRDSNFQLHFFQRIFLRLMFSLQKYFFVGVRGIGKTYLSNLASMIYSVLNPMQTGSIVSPMKEQGSKITQGSFEQIMVQFPFFRKEIILNEKGGIFHTDSGVDVIIFKNGSQLSVEFSKSQMRGLRKDWLKLEEYAMPTFDYNKTTSEILPTMSNSKASLHGSVDKESIQGQIGIITNANSNLSPAYKELVQIVNNFGQGMRQMVFSTDYRMSAMYRMLKVEHFLEAKYNPLSEDDIDFRRNYKGEWVGGMSTEIVDEQVLKSMYNIKYPVYKNNHKGGWRYVLVYDVASAISKIENANCALVVLRFRYNDNENDYEIECVNVEHKRGLAYEDQAKYLKSKAIDYDPQAFIVDTNGIGEGIIEWLLKENNEGLGCLKLLYEDLFPHDKKDVEALFAWKMKENEHAKKILYPLKAQGRFTKKIDMGIHIKNALTTRKVSFVDNSMLVGATLPSSVLTYFNIEKDNIEEINRIRNTYMEFELLSKEIRNIAQDSDSKELVRIDTGVLKDRFEALQYGLWVINRLILNDSQGKPEYDIKEFNYTFANVSNKYDRRGGGAYQRKGTGSRRR